MATQTGTPVTAATLPQSAAGPTPLIAGGTPRPGQPYWDAGTVQTEPGKTLSLKQLVDLAIQAGFPRTGEPNAAEAAAVAEYESSGQPGWYNPEYSVQPRGSTNGSYGLTQVYRAAHSDMAQKYNLLDPLGNLLAAREMTEQNVARGRRPWTGWTSVYGNGGVGIPAGGYLRYLTAAKGYAASSTAVAGNYAPPVTGPGTQTGTGATAAGATGFSLSDFLINVAGNLPVVGPALAKSGALGSLGDLGARLQGVFDWVSNPVRVIKLVVGVGLVIAAVVVLFLPEAAAVVTAAAGAPEAAPAVRRGVAGVTRGKSGPGKAAANAAGAGSSAAVKGIAAQQKPAPKAATPKAVKPPAAPRPQPAQPTVNTSSVRRPDESIPAWRKRVGADAATPAPSYEPPKRVGR